MAGPLNTGEIQVNDSATATNNFVLTPNNSGGIKLARGNRGATTQDVLTVDASGNVNAPVSLLQGGVAMPRMVLETAKATTSGTVIDFMASPSWAKKITVLFNGVSTNGTSSILIQLGSAGGVETTGYVSSAASIINAGTAAVSSSTAGIILRTDTAAETPSGFLTFCLLGSNAWVCSGNLVKSTSVVNSIAGSKTLSGTLDRIRITTVNGTDTFDAGSVNILYEG